MPDQAPFAPEGCVYGPWWDEEIRDEGCWCYSDGNLSYAWLPSYACWVVTEKAAVRELIRLAKQNAELTAQNKELLEGLEKMTGNGICCADGGGFFIPRYDGDGEYVGEEYLDPQSVAMGMFQQASALIAKCRGEKS